MDPLQQDILVFYETKMEAKMKRSVQNLCCLKSFGDYCVVILRTDEIRGAVGFDGFKMTVDQGS
jgi:hypothetical protein